LKLLDKLQLSAARLAPFCTFVLPIVLPIVLQMASPGSWDDAAKSKILTASYD
jgi:hypothetical protein